MTLSTNELVQWLDNPLILAGAKVPQLQEAAHGPEGSFHQRRRAVLADAGVRLWRVGDLRQILRLRSNQVTRNTYGKLEGRRRIYKCISREAFTRR